MNSGDSSSSSSFAEAPCESKTYSKASAGGCIWRGKNFNLNNVSQPKLTTRIRNVFASAIS